MGGCFVLVCFVVGFFGELFFWRKVSVVSDEKLFFLVGNVFLVKLGC